MLSKDELKTPRVFRPYGSIVIAATTASTSAVPMSTDTTATREQPSVRICNSSTSDYVQFAFATGTAGTVGTNAAMLPPGRVEVFDRGLNTHIAVIAASGTIPVSVTTGEGIIIA